ncbi:MAG: SAM-dependent chlorinase/fluorinase [Elusimicrobiales bacterium]|nr:SAM-dependent chlorinase/fluorinase [Elusimicrobiales bacterium]
MKTNIISLITDFGTSDPFVGMMKGVIYSKNNKVKIIDITHEIPPQDIKTAAFYLMVTLPYLPKNSICVCIVDPEVGTGRSILWVKTENHQIISPDNGSISWVEEVEKIKEVRAITNSNLFLKKVSHTFYGRDIIAPVAAELSKGIAEKELGPTYYEFRKIPFPHPQRIGNRILAEIIAIDRFGNAITNIKKDYVTSSSIFTIKDIIIEGLTPTYYLGKDEQEIALIGSYDFIEFSIKNSNFSKTHNIKTGDKVEVILNI